MAWFQTIPDSDKSISDEEEPDQDWADKCAKLGGTTEKKELLQISSRLEMLKGVNVNACNLEDEVSSDDVEVNNVVSKVSVNGGAKEFPNDDVHSFWSEEQDELYSWSVASKEAEALMRLNEKTSCSSSLSAYSNVKKSSKGAKGKGKPKFSFHFPTHKEGPSSLSISKDDSAVSFKVQELPERLDAMDPRNEEHSDDEHIEDIQGEEENLLAIVPSNDERSDVELLEDIQGDEECQLEVVPFEAKAIGHGTIGQSMAELLDGLQDKTTMLRGSSKKYSRKRRKREQPVVKCVSPLGDGIIDSESSPEHFGHGFLSDSKTDNQSLKLANPEMKRQTLVDRFQEAMSDRVLVAVPKTLRSRLFGKLQQVVQSEKESDMEFLKKIQEGASENEPNCMDVKILSKYLDAKLTVCHCFFGNSLKSLPWPESHEEMVDGLERTIIFNPRVCNDIDLDIGKWIRIHPPWTSILMMHCSTTSESSLYGDEQALQGQVGLSISSKLFIHNLHLHVLSMMGPRAAGGYPLPEHHHGYPKWCRQKKNEFGFVLNADLASCGKSAWQVRCLMQLLLVFAMKQGFRESPLATHMQDLLYYLEHSCRWARYG